MNVQQDTSPLLGSQTNNKVTVLPHAKRYFCLSGRNCLVFILSLVLGVAIITGLLVTFLYKDDTNGNHVCTDHCRFSLVESIPENLTYAQNETVHMSTFDALMELINSAERSIEIAAYYWSLRSHDVPFFDNSSLPGQYLFDRLLKIGKEQKVKIKIVQNVPSHEHRQMDSYYLQKYAHAEVKNIDFPRLIGAGILHTKLWLIDRRHFYVGSANTDWRSLTQVKELGVRVQNCSCLADDIGKIFDAYWYLADKNTTIPSTWPASYNTNMNNNTPEVISYDGNRTEADVYLSSSPPEICPEGRTVDIDAILNVIRRAKRFIYVAVMDYLPMVAYANPRKFWPVIDDELRRAAVDNGVTVYFLGSRWNHTDPDMPVFLQSLLDVGDVSKPNTNVQVRMFEVPVFTEAQAKIPFSRVNHNKYMVTDQHAYIATSNWYGDYFLYTGGIGFVLSPITIVNGTIDLRQQLEDVFLRDWNSNYSHPLSKEHNFRNQKDEL